MTLIITYINRHGIVHASDSNLTGANDRNAGIGQKTFAVPFLNAGLTVAGNYSVANVPMNTWMNNFIQQQQNVQNNSLELFSRALMAELQNNMSTTEKSNGCIIHIAGYVEVNGRSHPEFWFVRNVHGINQQTGEYENINDTFNITEDFWTRDCPARNLMQSFRDTNIYSRQIYINGFPSGRIGYNAVSMQLDEFFLAIWRVREWRFRQPQSLEETERLIKLTMRVINDMFILSDYNAHYIGGDIQTHLIQQPTNIVDRC